jgi:putative ABC transport system permease protein
MFVIIDVKRRSSNTDANVPLRGVDTTVLAVRTEAKIDGRMLQFGTNEVVVGRAASRQFVGINIGDVIHAGQVTWNVVGTFDTGGTVAETEIWCDARVLQGAYRRGNSYQSMLVKLDSAAVFDTFKDWLTKNPQLDVQVKRESDYEQQSTTRRSW